MARTIAGRTRPFDLVIHRGRRTGTEYRTPVSAFPGEQCLVIALTYGPEAEWVRNVRAAGSCTLVRRGARHDLVDPAVVPLGQQPAELPAIVRFTLARIRVGHVLVLSPPDL